MKRLAYLDALRGAAALLVVFQHVLERVTPKLYLLQICNIGTVGVLLFFLISGFVVPSSIKGDRPLRCFAISRMARLLPALWLSVAVMVALRGADLPTIGANMVMLAQPLGYPRLTDVYWTLTFELVFYGLCAALYAGDLLKCPRVVGTMVLACLVLSVTGKAPLFFFAYLLLGLLLRLAFLEGMASARGWSAAGIVAALATAIIHPLVVDAGMAQLGVVPRMTGNVVPLMAFLAILLWRPQPGAAFVYLGTISYSVYLFQDAVIDLATTYGPNDGTAFAAIVVLGLLAAASGVYHLVEKPFIIMGRRLASQNQSLLLRPG